MNFKKHKDLADGTLVVILVAMPMLVMVMTFILNIAQTNADKNELNSLVQNATQSGVQKVNAYGSLNSDSMIETVDRFYTETRDRTSVDNANSTLSGRLCTKDIVENNGVVKATDAPYFLEVTLRGERDNQNVSDSLTRNFTGPFNSGSGTYGARNLQMNVDDRYQVIEVRGWINVKSHWALPGQEPCRTHFVNISAVTFGSSGDVNYEEDFGDDSEPISDRNYDWSAEESWDRNNV